LVISVITMLVMLYQNSSFNDIFCLGTFGCESENKPYLFFLNAVYVIFWTWILNVLCVNNYTMLSWGGLRRSLCFLFFRRVCLESFNANFNLKIILFMVYYVNKINI
jgi:hypothetical protein